LPCPGACGPLAINGGALLEGEVFPIRFGVQGRINGLSYMVCITFMEAAKQVLMLVWRAHITKVLGADFLPTYVHGDV
jgi:hypothetical protein